MLGTESCLPCHPHALAPKECGQPATLMSLGWLLTGPGGDRGVICRAPGCSKRALEESTTPRGC